MTWSHQKVYNDLVKKGNYEKKSDKNKYVSLDHHRLRNLTMVFYRPDTESYARAPLHINNSRPGFSEDLFRKISPAIDFVSHGGHGWETYRIIDWGKLAEALDL
ncbi:MAG: hypothetical protein ABII26_01005 [Pseudomonadota bacterium]